MKQLKSIFLILALVVLCGASPSGSPASGNSGSPADIGSLIRDLIDDGTFTLFVEGGQNVTIGKREDIELQ